MPSGDATPHARPADADPAQRGRNPETVSALIVAAGRGTRFASSIPKQYLPLAGTPVLTRTLRTFDACDVIDRMVLVVPGADIAYVREAILSAAGLRKELCIVPGGAHRQDSVRNGLAAITDDDSLVVIHDAVRPLVSCCCISACVENAQQTGACIVAVPACDTLKRSTAAGTVESTLAREGVWLAQTPQAFRAGLIRAAHAKARQEHYRGTDDASLVERMGNIAVRILAGSRRNIKITTAEDLDIAAALLGADAGDPIGRLGTAGAD